MNETNQNTEIHMQSDIQQSPDTTPQNTLPRPDAAPQHAPSQANVPPQYTPQPQPTWDIPPYATYGETPEQKKKRAVLFEALFFPTLLYAVLYTFFLYDALSSITVPLFVITTIIYCFHCLKKVGIQRKKGSYFYAAAMLLLGFSSATTGSVPIIAMNLFGIIFLLICMLLHNFYDDSRWTFGKYLASIFLAIFGAIGSIGDPFCDAASYQKSHEHKRQSKMLYIVIGVAISIPLLIVIILLLYYADAVFAQFIRNIRLNLNFITITGVFCTFLFALFSAYCGIRFLGKRKIKETSSDCRKFEPLVAITILALISIVYLFFSLIQFLYLFWGKMQLPSSYTYAAYAREGFFQLLFVCIFNVIIVLLILAFFRKNTVLNILLTVISFCTYIMLASSAFRMYMYIQNYNLTFLRIFVLWSLAVIALLLAGILVQIFSSDFPLFKYGLLTVCVSYLVLSFSHSDYWIARYNLENMDNQSVQNMDYYYLSQLSSDAAPIIAQYDGAWVENYIRNLTDSTDDSLRQFNFSHAYARSLFADEVYQAENSFTIQLRNDSAGDISDVMLHFYQEDFPIMIQETEQMEDSEGSQVFSAIIWKEDLKEPLDKLIVSYTFTDAEGKYCSSDEDYFYPEFGGCHTGYLSGGEEYEDYTESYTIYFPLY